MNLKTVDIKIFLLAFILTSTIFPLAGSADSATFSREYQSDEELRTGVLVSREVSRPKYVTKADVNNNSRLLGVVTTEDGAFFSVSSTEANVMVATEGTELVFVSTVNGDISAGDFITASPLRGIGMKAGSGGKVLGVAEESFSNEAENAEEVTITRDGEEEATYVGKIPVNIDIREVAGGEESRSEISRFIQETTETVAGRSVSPLRALSAALVALAAFIITILVVTNAARGSIVAVGRNPLAKKDIVSALLRIVLLGGLIIVSGTALAYFILIV